jgi:hypothetical protein
MVMPAGIRAPGPSPRIGSLARVSRTERPAVGRRGASLAVLGYALLCTPLSAYATEGDVGVSVGGMVAGTIPRLAISPHGWVGFRFGDGFRIGIRDMLSILPASDSHGIGVYNQLSGTIGFAWEAVDFSLGPSFGLFSMPACGTALCAHLKGVAPGGSAQASVYFAGPLGVSARINVDWMNGVGNVLPPSVVAVFVAGPVVRWNVR